MGCRIGQRLGLVLLEKGLEFFRRALYRQQMGIGMLRGKLHGMFAFACAYFQTHSGVMVGAIKSRGARMSSA
jgi:hypothetical protein